MRVFLTGGTGLIGRRLAACLRGRGDEVRVLTRDPAAAAGRLPAGCEPVAGDPCTPGPWEGALEGCDAVVHLAGENLFARRWNAAFRKVLWDSRVIGTRQIVSSVRQMKTPPKVLVSGSAVGWYGYAGDEVFDESSGPGSGFLADLSREWEAAVPASAPPGGLRTVLLRTGVVLDPDGGALGTMLPAFRWFVGGAVGSGRQWMSWIHRDDMSGLAAWAVDDDRVSGPINAVAPWPVTNRQFATELGRAMGRPSFAWTPGVVLRVALGPVADVVRCGQRVVPRRALQLGFRFRFPEVAGALADLLAK